MNIKKLNQQELDDIFIGACSSNDLETIKKLHAFYPPIKAIYSSFLKIFNINKPTLNFHIRNCLGLTTVCENGHIDILKYFLSIPEFFNQPKFDGELRIPRLSKTLKEVKEYPVGLISEKFTDSLFISVSNKHFNIANLLIPIIEKNSYFRYAAYQNYLEFCRVGNLEAVKFVLTDKNLNFQHNGWINGKYNSSEPNCAGFVEACKWGNLDIVKYHTSSSELSENTNLNNIEKTLQIYDLDIIRHFIFDLAITRGSYSILTNLILFSNTEANALFDKQELLYNLEKNLEINDTLTKPKRIKI